MSTSFAELGVPAHLVERLKHRGITEAFPIQIAAIPDALNGVDVVGKAATGSGKTLAFGLPLMARTEKARPRQPGALVLVPTRELAAQVQKELAQLSEDKGRRIIAIYGGTPYHVARKALNFGVDVVVACPGRLEDMLEQGAFDLRAVTTVVVDEADRMADMGFLPAVRRIVNATSPDRHVMLFSATMGPDVKSLVNNFTHNAAIHDVVGEESPSDVEHFFWRTSRDERPDIVADLIEQYERAIVFTRTKHGADRLAKQLGQRGLSAVALHGDRTQAQRERALKAMKAGDVQVLVATDVAARGIHIELLPVVVHYDPPAQATDYLHRSGRTGRAGATGVVISLVADDAVGAVRQIQRALKLPVIIEDRASAPAMRIGAVNDADAAQRIDDGSRDRGGERRGAAKPRFDRPRRNVDTLGRERPARAKTEARDVNRSRDESSFGANRHETPRHADRADTTSRGFDRGEPTRRSPSGDHAIVSFFNDSKGFGFASDTKGDDLFIHFSNIVGDGFRTLSEGQTIAFEEAQGPKGREARNVRVVGGASRGGDRRRR